MRVAERRGGSETPNEHAFVEALHQLRGRAIVDLPQTRDDAWSAGIHEPACKTDEPFAADVLSQCGLTRAQDDQVCAELQVVDVVQPKKPLLRTALLYYYRARYYEPGIARFISEDPIGFAGGFNTHTYVDGDPVANTDPSGLQVANQSPFPYWAKPEHDQGRGGNTI